MCISIGGAIEGIAEDLAGLAGEIGFTGELASEINGIMGDIAGVGQKKMDLDTMCRGFIGLAMKHRRARIG